MRVAVIGGGAAGMAAASRAKRLLKNAVVTVFEKTEWVSFALCGIPYYIGCITHRLNDLVYYPLEEFIEKRGIDVRVKHEVTDIDVNSKTLTFKTPGGSEESYEWDYLVVAPGAKSLAPTIFPEIKELNHVRYIAHLNDAHRIRNEILSLRENETINIVGSGYVGLELAHVLRESGYKVRIIEMTQQVLPKSLDHDMAEIVSSVLKANNVEVILGEKTVGFEEKNSRVKTITEKGEYDAAYTIVGVGIKPNTQIAEKIGAKLGETGAIWVDDHMKTSVEDVYAVGDAVETVNLVTGRRGWFPFAQVANKMGYVAGSNIGGREAVFPGATGTSTLKVFDTTVARTGLTEDEAVRLGYNVVTAKLDARTKAHYIPGGKKFTLKVIADADTGRLLGAQGVGPDESVFWRINIVAALLERQGTVWDLFYTDIGYAPVLNPTWDALVVAARLLMRKLGEVPRKA
ncbi:MAG: FAD-dependent oxidoreductase [Desulfurococcales archaeon]|nr:FAD-dependent oxidoreductase [Desulfurococcales archaeon]